MSRQIATNFFLTVKLLKPINLSHFQRKIFLPYFSGDDTLYSLYVDIAYVKNV